MRLRSGTCNECGGVLLSYSIWDVLCVPCIEELKLKDAERSLPIAMVVKRIGEPTAKYADAIEISYDYSFNLRRESELSRLFTQTWKRVKRLTLWSRK